MYFFCPFHLMGSFVTTFHQFTEEYLLHSVQVPAGKLTLSRTGLRSQGICNLVAEMNMYKINALQIIM